jgi:hypothetical protein
MEDMGSKLNDSTSELVNSPHLELLRNVLRNGGEVRSQQSRDGVGIVQQGDATKKILSERMFSIVHNSHAN